MNAGDRVVVRLDAMAHGGEAFGRAEDGRVVFVAGGLPGETVEARLTEVRERFAHAVLAAVPTPPSPDRILGPPRCPVFRPWPERGEAPAEACGGCQWQHAAYGAQLRYKADVLADALRRIGGVEAPPVAPAIGMDDPWRYRNHIRVRAGPGGAGFVAVDGASVVPTPVCHIAHPRVQELLDALDPDLPPGTEVALRAGVNTGDGMLVVEAPPEAIEAIEVEAEASVVLARPDGSLELAAGRPYLVEEIEGRRFIVPPRAFFQVNTAMTPALLGAVRAAIPPGTARLVDAYSGVGLFAVLLAGDVGEVVSIESEPVSVAAGVDNAEGLENVTLLEADVAEGLAHLGPGVDVVLVDPPRAGLAPEVVRLLGAQAPDTIVYVSCEPATLARDVRQLVAAGYRLEAVQPVDLFPQTFHVESVATLRRPPRRKGS